MATDRRSRFARTLRLAACALAAGVLCGFAGSTAAVPAYTPPRTGGPPAPAKPAKHCAGSSRRLVATWFATWECSARPASAGPSFARCYPRAAATHYPSRRRRAARRTSRVPWAELLRRVFATDVLSCPGAGRRVVAVVVDSVMARVVLATLGMPCTPATFAPARNRRRASSGSTTLGNPCNRDTFGWDGSARTSPACARADIAGTRRRSAAGGFHPRVALRHPRDARNPACLSSPLLLVLRQDDTP